MKNNKGFTIVEVMIVLAVAGLILAVVFIAVPALQRNQRNNARKNDVAYIRTTFTTAVANKGNQLPTSSEFGSVIKADELSYIQGVVTTGSGTIAIANNTAVNALGEATCLAAGQTWASGQCNQPGGSTQVTPTVLCTGLGGILTPPNCAIDSSIVFRAATTTGTNITLSDSGDEALVVTNAKCNGATQSYPAAGVDLDTGGVNVALPDYTRQSVVFYRLEGDENLYCNNI